MDLKGKVVLITGGGTGLGKEIALQLAREGMNVAVNYSRSQQDAEETVAELQSLGVKAQAIKADVGKPAEAKRLVEETAEIFGKLDLLINNAGTTRFVAMSNLDGLNEEDWDDILNVNTKAPFFTAQAAAPIMRKNGGGQIINTTSVAGFHALGSSLAYCVSKAGMNHLTKCLAVALGPDIRVNAVAPGLLLTRWGVRHGPEVIQKLNDATPLKKAVSLEDCAAAYVMLAKNECMTGEIIVVDSGRLLV
jgi:3-oxoacyl-[acyl-carrier protein] reductase